MKEGTELPFEYLPVMAQNSAPKPPRVLAAPTKPAWQPVEKPVSRSCIALLSSAAIRLESQEPFVPREDLSFRRLPSDPQAGRLIIDHHSGIGRVPKQDPEIVFPRTALAHLAEGGIVGSLSSHYFSLMGGLRDHKAIENMLAPALAKELSASAVDLALLVPY